MLNIDKHLTQISEEHIDGGYYHEKIKQYRNECGCALSAIFLTVSIIALSIYVIILPDWHEPNTGSFILSGFAFLLLSSFVGKIIGIGLARVKLKLLHRAFVRKNHLSSN